MKKTRFKQLLLVGLGNIASGMLFGAGCIIIEHADSTWWHVEKDASQQDDVASNEDPNSESTAVGITAVKPKSDNARLAQGNRRLLNNH